MCGIAALWGADDPDVVEKMLARMPHRGPDGQGVDTLRSGTGVLGHQRLAIIDPARGHQPMRSRDGDQALIVNGMIYNFEQLKSRLNSQDFTTGSDSETILHGYREWGDEVVERLDGMFAFVLVDGDRLVAARDPLGIKPLYTGQLAGARVFASEIKALAGIAGDVEEFPPGHLFTSDTGFAPYYALPEAAVGNDAVPECLSVVRETLEQAVLKRLRSDVPLGCFLSGGLDSSLIAAIASRHVDELHTFSVGLEGSTDLAAAREVADHLGTIHHERTVSSTEAIDALPNVVGHLESFDRDLVRNAVPTWFVSREAASHGMKVVLTGEGADEIFAGYSYYEDYIADPMTLQQELRRSLTSLHDMNLQRVDRMTMAHGLEARVPFLDTSMVSLGMRIDPEIKRASPDGMPVEKWILRKACEDLLPTHITWRTKAQFADGSGFGELFAGLADRGLSGTAGAAEKSEEAYYRDLLFDHLQDEDAVNLTTHWRDNRVLV